MVHFIRKHGSAVYVGTVHGGYSYTSILQGENWAHCGICRYVETSKATRLGLHQIVDHFRGWIGRVECCCPLHTTRWMEIVIDVCVGHGPLLWCVLESFLWKLATF